MIRNAYDDEASELMSAPIDDTIAKAKVPSESQPKSWSLDSSKNKVGVAESRESPPPAQTVTFQTPTSQCPKCSLPLVYQSLATHKNRRRYPITLFPPLSSLNDNESTVFLSEDSTQQGISTLQSNTEPHLMAKEGTITNGMLKTTCRPMQSILEQFVGNYCDSICEPVNAANNTDFNKSVSNMKITGEEYNNNYEMQMVPPYCANCESYIVQEGGEAEKQDETLNRLVLWLSASRSTDDGINEGNSTNESLRPSKGSITVALDRSEQHRGHRTIWSNQSEDDLCQKPEIRRLPPRPQQTKKYNNKAAGLAGQDVFEKPEQLASCKRDRYFCYETEDDELVGENVPYEQIVSSDPSSQQHLSPRENSVNSFDSGRRDRELKPALRSSLESLPNAECQSDPQSPSQSQSSNQKKIDESLYIDHSTNNTDKSDFSSDQKQPLQNLLPESESTHGQQIDHDLFSQHSIRSNGDSQAFELKVALPKDPPASGEENSLNVTPTTALFSVTLPVPVEQSNTLPRETTLDSVSIEAEVDDQESVGTNYTLEEKKNIIDQYEQK